MLSSRASRTASSSSSRYRPPTIARPSALGLDPLEAQIRQVFFFDTPDLDLNAVGVVARARRIQGRPEDA